MLAIQHLRPGHFDRRYPEFDRALRLASLNLLT